MNLFICICLCHIVLSVFCSLVVTCWERADLLALLYLTFCCDLVIFQYGILGQVGLLSVSIPAICILPYFGIVYFPGNPELFFQSLFPYIYTCM